MMVAALSCQREEILTRQESLWAGDGRKVDIVIPLSADGLVSVSNTKALDEAGERNVQDIYIAFFPIVDANGNGTVDPGEVRNKVFGKYYTYNDITPATAEPNHYNAGSIELFGVPTGTYYVVGVANVQYGAHNNFLEELEAAVSWDEVNAIAVSLREETGMPVNIDRNTPALCMSGFYKEPGATESRTPTAVTLTNGGKLPGYIHLRRLDSQITFIIKNEIPNCTEFCMTDWKMYNVPVSSSIFEQESDIATTYKNTNVRRFWNYTPRTATDSEQFAFSFYMMENRGVSKSPITSYKQREEEYKINDGSDKQDHNFRDADGNREYTHYKYAPDNSAFLQFNATMVQDVTEGGVTFPRVATMHYVVHLGYCEPQDCSDAEKEALRAGDFNNRRNTKYTYTITIRGVNDIVVEAHSDQVYDPSFSNGVEGNVVDLNGGQVEQLDTHFGTFNVSLTRREIMAMQTQIHSAAGDWSSVSVATLGGVMTDAQYAAYVADPSTYAPYPDYRTEDYQAIRIAPLPKDRDVATRLVSYSETYDFDWPEAQASWTTPTTLLPPHGEKKVKQDATHTVPFFDIVSFQRAYGTPRTATNPWGYIDLSDSAAEGHLDEVLNFTIFVNEYYYYYPNAVIPPSRTLDTTTGAIVSGDNVDPMMWKRIANTGHRYFRILSNAHDSKDDDSHHLSGKIHIEQRAIQTYYSDKVDVAVALEHINEHHWKLMTEGRGRTGSGHGWSAAKTEISGQNWDNRADQTYKIGEGYPTFQTSRYATATGSTALYNFRRIGNNSDVTSRDKWTGRDGYFPTAGDAMDKNYYEVLDAAVSRNRDLDRNNTISDDEIRWYTPYMDQYVDFVVGQGALETPLFKRDDYKPEMVGSEQVYANRRYHYISTNRQYLWSEEGTSTGGGVYGWEIRCCRILGTENYAGNLHLATPYEYNQQTRVFKTERYAENGIHRGYTVGALAPHNNLELESNALPYYFKMAKADSPLNDQLKAAGGLTRQEILWNRMITNEYCRNYTEDPDAEYDDAGNLVSASDMGAWHVPNQMELALMFYGAGLRPSIGQYVSSTYWWRNDGTTTPEGSVANTTTDWRHFMGANGSNLRMLHTGQDLYGSRLSVRCVIDTDQDGNPAGSPEYGNPINFHAGDFGCVYVGEDQANYTVSATMDASQISSVSVKIDGYSASSTGSGTVQSSVSGADVNKAEVTVVWTIVTTSGKTLTYKQPYTLPARYWMISRYGATNRYIYTDVNDNNRVTIDSPYSGDLNDKDAVFKWIITKNPTSNPVNESELEINQTYYLYNAGTGTYVDGGAANNRLTTGGTPAPFQLRKRSEAGREDYYGLFFTGKNQYMNGNGTTQITFWSGFDDGSTQLLSPVVLKGEMPLKFEFAENYVDTGTGYSVSVETESGVAVNSVTIGGITANVSGSDGHFTATVNGTISGGAIATVWNVTKGGRSYSRTHTYAKPVKYYVISSAASGHTTQYGYVVPETERTVADAAANSTAPSDLGENYRFIITREKTDNPVNVSTLTTTDTYYFYSVALGKYLSGPRPVSSAGYSDSYLTFSESFTPYTFVLKQFGSAYSLNINNCSGHPNLCFASWGTTYDYSKLGIFETSNQNRDGFRFILTPVY